MNNNLEKYVNFLLSIKDEIFELQKITFKENMLNNKTFKNKKKLKIIRENRKKLENNLKDEIKYIPQICRNIESIECFLKIASKRELKSISEWETFIKSQKYKYLTILTDIEYINFS